MDGRTDTWSDIKLCCFAFMQQPTHILIYVILHHRHQHHHQQQQHLIYSNTLSNEFICITISESILQQYWSGQQFIITKFQRANLEYKLAKNLCICIYNKEKLDCFKSIPRAVKCFLKFGTKQSMWDFQCNSIAVVFWSSLILLCLYNYKHTCNQISLQQDYIREIRGCMYALVLDGCLSNYIDFLKVDLTYLYDFFYCICNIIILLQNI